MPTNARKFSRRYRPVAASTLRLSENSIEWDDDVSSVGNLVEVPSETETSENDRILKNVMNVVPIRAARKPAIKSSNQKKQSISKKTANTKGKKKDISLLRASFREKVPWQHGRERKPRDSLDSLTSISDASDADPCDLVSTPNARTKQEALEQVISEDDIDRFCCTESWLLSCNRSGLLYLFQSVQSECEIALYKGIDNTMSKKERKKRELLTMKAPLHWSQQQREQVAAWCVLCGFECFWRGGMLHFKLQGRYLKRMQKLLQTPPGTQLPKMENLTLKVTQEESPAKPNDMSIHSYSIFSETKLSQDPSSPQPNDSYSEEKARRKVAADLVESNDPRRGSNSSLDSISTYSQEDEWTSPERVRFNVAIRQFGPGNWDKVQAHVGTRTAIECASFYASDIARGKYIREKQSVRKKWNVNVKRPGLGDERFSVAESSVMLRRLSVAVNQTARANRRKSSIFPVQYLKERTIEEADDRFKEQDDFAVTNLSEMLEEVAIEDSAIVKKTIFTEEQESTIISLVLEYLELNELRTSVFAVNWSWNAFARVAINSVSSSLLAQVLTKSLVDGATKALASSGALLYCWKGLRNQFPVGSFVSEGSYKKVYKVWNRCEKREEAISVMDVAQIAECSNPDVVAKEVSVALLLSELVRTGICPNYVQTFQVFQFAYAPPNNTWGFAANENLSDVVQRTKMSSESEREEGFYQYIRMELCTGGDVEEYLKSLPEDMMDLDQVKETAFQMCYSLLVARDRVSLRHYDVKLLNFFIAFAEATTETMRFTVCDTTFVVHPTQKNDGSNLFLIPKLADYGTAVTGNSSLGSPVTVDQFTTLENTPIDFLLFDDAADSFAADTFSLGLATLHLFTGSCPYEEIMEDALCPPALIEAWEAIWESEVNGFDAIKKVLADDQDGILFHTLYRYMVLMHGTYTEEDQQYLSRSLVWSTAMEILNSKLRGRTKEASTKRTCQRAFKRDCKKYSLQHGSNRLIARGRERLQESTGAYEFLLQMLKPDPTRRSRMVELLFSDYFLSLRSMLKVDSDEFSYSTGTTNRKALH